MFLALKCFRRVFWNKRLLVLGKKDLCLFAENVSFLIAFRSPYAGLLSGFPAEVPLLCVSQSVFIGKNGLRCWAGQHPQGQRRS